MVGPEGAASGVGCGIDSGEGTELVGEVGLVVEAAVEGEVSPGDVYAGVKLIYGALEALDAAPGFGREADFFAEDLREAAFAPAGVQSHGADGGEGGHAMEVLQCEVDLRDLRR